MSEQWKLMVLGAIGSAALAVAVWSAIAVTQSHDAVTATAHRVEAVCAAVEAQAEVVELPDDGQAYYTTLLLHDDWRAIPAERALVSAFQTDSLLQSVRAQTHFNVYTQSNPLYRDRFSRSVPALPAVLIQDASGKVLVKVSGEAATGDIEAVRGPIRRLWQARPIYVLPWRRPAPCPEPTPVPSPPVEPEPIPDVAPIPDTAPMEPFPWWLAIVAALVGAMVPVVGYINRVLYGES